MRTDRERADALLRRFGHNPLSTLIHCEGPWRFFFADGAEGAAPYMQRGRAVVLWGDPLCAAEDTAAVVGEFTRAMRGMGLKICAVAIDEGTARAALAAGYSVLKIGEEPHFDLIAWRRPRGNRGKHLRWCVNHARRAGLEVAEYRPENGRDRALEAELAGVQASWEASLRRPVVQGVLRPAPLEDAGEKRIFYARSNGRVEALVACSPVYGRDGWYLEDLIRLPTAVNGATELLVVELLGRLAASGGRFASLGIAPLRGSEVQLDRRARWLGTLLALTVRHLDRRFHFTGLSRYSAKFVPSDWEPRYVAFSPALPGPGVVRAARWVLDP